MSEVLVVEADGFFGAEIKEKLTAKGFNVELHSTIESAFYKLHYDGNERYLPDLLIVNTHITTGSALGLIASLLDPQINRPECPVIAIGEDYGDFDSMAHWLDGTFSKEGGSIADLVALTCRLIDGCKPLPKLGKGCVN